MKIISLLLVCILLTSSFAFGQEAKNFKKLTPKKFIDRIEFILGPTLQIPDDNGFSEMLKQSSRSTIFESYNSKFGYSFGFGLYHSISERIEINGTLLWEQKGFIEEKKSISSNSPDFTLYKGNLKSEYVSLAIAPVFYFSKKRKAQFYPSFYYSWLQGSFRKEESYRNNQLTFTGSTTNDPNLKDDYGVSIGGGYSISLNAKINLALRLQFNYGLAKIMDINSLKINNNSISLFMALSFQKIRN